MNARLDTWMPLYVGDYLQDTMHLSAEQHGMYLLLIMACWKGRNMLPSDETQLAAIARVSLKTWKAQQPVIAPFFHVEDDHWEHKRVALEISKAERISERRSKAGANGAAKRWQADGKRNGRSMASR